MVGVAAVGDVRSQWGQGSDLASVETLYVELAPTLLRWLRGRLPDVDVATDLLAETFAQVVCGIGRLRGDTFEQAAAWVWGIARNLLRRYYREQRIERSARERLGLLANASSPGPEEAPRADPVVGSVLRAALSQLPERTRACVWMRLVDELSYGDIAEQLSCSEPLARQRVSRGLRRLATLMEAER